MLEQQNPDQQAAFLERCKSIGLVFPNKRPERFVVTGLGALTPIGNCVEQFWANALKGRHGFEVVPIDQGPACQLEFVGAPIKNFNGTKFYPERSLRDFPLVSQYAFAAGFEAGIDAKVFEPFLIEGSPRCQLIGFTPPELGAVTTTAIGGATYAGEVMTRILNDKRVHPLSLDFLDPNVADNRFHRFSGITGPGETLTVACAGGLSGYKVAAAQLLCAREDSLFPRPKGMFVIGSESILADPILPRAYSAMSDLYTKERSDLDQACRPFDLNFGGVVIGDGAVAGFLEPLSQAITRKRKNPSLPIYGELIGIGDNTTPNLEQKGQTSSNGIKDAIEQAITRAKISPEEIDLVVTHGPATKSDINEANAI